MKRLMTIALGILCLAVVTVEAQEKKKGARRPALTAEQKALTKEIREKYDTNKDGKLDAEERKKISADDKAKLEKAGLGPKKKKDKAKSDK